MPDPGERAHASGSSLRIVLEGVLTGDDAEAFSQTLAAGVQRQRA